MTKSLLSILVLAAGLAPAQERPNIVFILTDDMGWGDTQPYGVKDIQTPAIARLAKEGVRLTHNYSNGPLCTPTRTAFLTGRYQQRVGLETALSKTNPAHLKAGLSPREATIASILKDSGYATAIFGKWHVGFEEQFNPVHHGFDEFFGLLGGNIDMYSHKGREGDDDLWEGTTPVKKEGYATDLIADRAVAYIERSGAKPFFLYLPFNAVHWPFQPPKRPTDVRDEKTWLDGSRQDYKLMLEGLDDAIGRVVTALDKKGIAGNTIVVFTNDNGGERFSSNGGLFHHKGTLWEGGIRVPAIVRWPERLPRGVTSNQPSATFDFTASLIAAAGAKLPPGRELDGADIFPILRGEKAPVERTIFWRFDQPQGGRRQWAVRRGKWKLVRDGNNAIPSVGAIDLLFDLEADPQERNDRALDHPQLVEELRQEIKRWEEGIAKGNVLVSSN